MEDDGGVLNQGMRGVEWPAGVRVLDHPADIGIEARGATCAEAFSRAASGLMCLIVGSSRIVAREERSVILHSSDREQLLFRWLSEVLFLYDSYHFLLKESQITSCTPTLLEASLSGETLDPAKHVSCLEVKAVTYHQLSVWQDADGWCVRVFVDI